MTAAAPVSGVEIRAAASPRADEILSPPALAFLADLHRRFDARRRELLARRAERQKRFDAGELPDFLIETRAIREGDWKVAPIPADLLDRRVEITGPVDRKMIVNALNSGAKVFMADFEDASSPVFANMIEGQANLLDLWNGRIDFTDPTSGKLYAVKPNPAALMVRPRGWHLDERHLRVDGQPMSGSLFDFGLYVFHSAKLQQAKGSTPAFYLPKLESHLEARLWNDVFSHAEATLGVAHGTFKATILIETLPARVRDGRDPVRAARPHRRPQLRPLGLHLLVHQAARQEPRLPHPRPRGDDDGQGVPQRLFAAADQDLPQARRLRDGRHGGADPDQGRPGRQRGRLRQGARRQGARSRPTATTAPGSPIPISCRWRSRCSTG